MAHKENLYLCMGSACHQLGVYDVLPKVQALLAQYQLESVIELKGAFCLGPCSEGVVIQFEDKPFTEITVDNIEQRFAQEILPYIYGLKE
jgi:NADH:ubiquinone oxidoreductase subunit E